MLELAHRLLTKYFYLFLILLVLISYGQILWMQPWQDDNALFFKMAHIEEAAGFIGKGPFGEGPYKYGVTPFIPIYKLFGFFTPAYFGLALLLYIIATLVIYKSISTVIGKTGGKIAAFIFACGYVISDGVWRLANSVTTSISIIIANLFLISYWKFYKEKKIKWYFFALLSYWAGVEFEVSRMHYFIAVVVAFEIIYLTFRRPLIKSIFFSILRLVPFLVLFELKVIVNDSRINGAGSLVFEILRGKFDLVNGILSSLTNLFIPDWLTATHTKSLVLIAVAILLVGLILFIKLKSDRKKLLLFFSIWVVANLYAYASYLPNITFGTTDRYLAHSFFALTAIIAIIFTNLNWKTLLGKIGIFLIIFLSLGNLLNNINLQRNILITRSYPVKSFYDNLKTYLPEISKGDILYFNVGKSREGVYADAISTAMMPNSTAFAWRYGIDRYDLTLTTDFNEVSELVKTNKTNPDNIHSYSYSSTGLSDTSTDLNNYFKNKITYNGQLNFTYKSSTLLNPTASGTKWTQPDINIDLSKSLNGVTPLELDLGIQSQPLQDGNIQFPLYSLTDKINEDSPWKDTTQRSLSLAYQKEMTDFIQKATFETDNEWQNNVTKNLYDDDPTTYWQSDRVLWQAKEDYIKVKLPSIENISAISWMNNTYSGSIPTSYEIDVSKDGISWLTVKKVSLTLSPTDQQYQIVSFDPVLAKYVEMKITDTFRGDSPMVAEFRVIPQNLSNLDIKNAINFLGNPFLFVSDGNSFNTLISSIKQVGMAKVYWMSTGETEWSTNKTAELNLLYDNRKHLYKIILPVEAAFINKIKISGITFPGNLTLTGVSYHGLNFK